MIEWTQDQLPTGPALVMFYGPNCAPCNAMKPTLKDLEAQEGCPVYLVNSHISVLAARYRVRTVPTVLMVDKNGLVNSRRDGAVSAGILGQMITAVTQW